MNFVIEPGRFIPIEELPRSAKSLAKLAASHGWSVHCGTGLAYEPDTTHYGPDGEWDRARRVTYDEPQFEDDGSPVMTKPAKNRTSTKPFVPQQVIKKIPVVPEVLVQRRWVAVRCTRGQGELVHATWVTPPDSEEWAIDSVMVGGIGLTTVAQARAVLGA